MIVGCYSMHLYCEVCGVLADIAAGTVRRCVDKARRAGWRVATRRGLAWCPQHAAHGRRAAGREVEVAGGQRA